jgi:hypothetical protein
MNEATKRKPELLKQTDIVSFYHIQMPRWLFADRRYNYISLAAKVAYSLLLNRYQLSKMNGWINGDGEVYIIFTREELAAELQVGARKAAEVFRELTGAGLVWETRRGNNKANLIYLTRVELSPEDASEYGGAPFAGRHDAESGTAAGGAENACPDLDEPGEDTGRTEATPPRAAFGHAKNAAPDTRKTQARTRGKGQSGPAETAPPDTRNPRPSNTYVRDKETSHPDSSQSVRHPRAREGGETEELDGILKGCELELLSPETAKVFESAIERLYFCESFRIGGCVLPRERVRAHLKSLDLLRLREAEAKISRNTEARIKNTTAYTMAVIFNCIWETESDLMCDPYLNRLRSPPPKNRGGDV